MQNVVIPRNNEVALQHYCAQCGGEEADNSNCLHVSFGPLFTMPLCLPPKHMFGTL